MVAPSKMLERSPCRPWSCGTASASATAGCSSRAGPRRGATGSARRARPSPPSAFCQEKVTTSSLAQSSSWAKAALVASQMTMPSRSAEMKSAFGTRTPRGGAVPGEHQVGVGADLGRGPAAGRRGRPAPRRRQLQLLGHVGDPVLAEAFEGQQLNRLGAQHRPHGHLDGAGVGAGDDADQEVVRNLQHLAGAVDRLLQARLAGLGRGASVRGRRSGDFRGSIRGAWRTGRKRIRDAPGAWPASARVFIAMSPILTDEQRPVGGAWPAGQRPAFSTRRKKNFLAVTTGDARTQASGLPRAIRTRRRQATSRADDQAPDNATEIDVVDQGVEIVARRSLGDQVVGVHRELSREEQHHPAHPQGSVAHRHPQQDYGREAIVDQADDIVAVGSQQAAGLSDQHVGEHDAAPSIRSAEPPFHNANSAPRTEKILINEADIETSSMIRRP